MHGGIGSIAGGSAKSLDPPVPPMKSKASDPSDPIKRSRPCDKAVRHPIHQGSWYRSSHPIRSSDPGHAIKPSAILSSDPDHPSDPAVRFEATYISQASR